MSLHTNVGIIKICPPLDTVTHCAANINCVVVYSLCVIHVHVPMRNHTLVYCGVKHIYTNPNFPPKKKKKTMTVCIIKLNEKLISFINALSLSL